MEYFDNIPETNENSIISMYVCKLYSQEKKQTTIEKLRDACKMANLSLISYHLLNYEHL